jgi:hypothetical protein
MTELTLHTSPETEANPENLFDAARLRAIAALADGRGDVRFTPGGGILFDTPITSAEKLALPLPSGQPLRFLDLPEDRFESQLGRDAEFRAFVSAFTIAHVAPKYRLVAIPLNGRLTPAQLRGLADAAQSFGHDKVRITADVSVRLTHVPTALLRPLFRSLKAAGLLTGRAAKLAA